METNYWSLALAVLAELTRNLVYANPDGAGINERHLHHLCTHRLQARGLRLALGAPAEQATLHVEWRTNAGCDSHDKRGRYQKDPDGFYHPDVDGKRGLADLALGPYTAPVVGIEFKRYSQWPSKAIVADPHLMADWVFDLTKLLTAPNLQAGISYLLVLQDVRRADNEPVKSLLDTAFEHAKCISGHPSRRCLALAVELTGDHGCRSWWRGMDECTEEGWPSEA